MNDVKHPLWHKVKNTVTYPIFYAYLWLRFTLGEKL